MDEKKSIFEILSENKKKIGAGIAGGTSVLAICLGLMNDKIESAERRAYAQKDEIMREVDHKHESVMSELKHISELIVDANKKIDKLDQRIYELNKKDQFVSINNDKQNKN